MILSKDQRDSLDILDQADLIHNKYKDLRKENLELTKLDAFNLASKYILDGLTPETLELSQRLDINIAIEQRARLEEYKKMKRSA